MNFDAVLEVVLMTLPTVVVAVVVGGVLFFLITRFLKHEENRRRYELLRETKVAALPMKLQAYERMVLFLERINLSQILLRVLPPSTDKIDYATLLEHSIQTEFEHNLAQQIYVSGVAWDAVLKAKNSTVSLIRNAVMDNEVLDANGLREQLLVELAEQGESASSVAIAILKNDLKLIF